ncbi:thermonuclease family protein [Shewanella zhangzhouensis]|uniref:thermonuclease family protein n=1 Tax=Shewanella zhangzhouensis TaxID=2864213 RepID=UPI001C661E23|nr:thermonuclease family protein [Shewanella zhangzhouensis]QYK04912.1 thermonuclease family protein [Shewanella zhangzhouensis]
MNQHALWPLLGALIASQSLGATQPPATVSQVISIYDGDSFTVNVDEWPPVLGEKITVRIKGIDTPELRGKCEKEVKQAREAKQFTVAKLREARTIRLSGIERDKYFRILADVDLDGVDLGQLLLRSGLAVPYGGAKKPDWCQ